MEVYSKGYAVERDGIVTSNSDLSPAAQAILEKIARSAYLCDMHRQGIDLNQARIRALQAELAELERQP